jgi:hypothetical protein
MPETRFEDILVIDTSWVDIKDDPKMRVELDREFIHVCENESIKPISWTSSTPCICGVSVKGGKDPYLVIEFSRLLPVPDEVVVKISGIRSGRFGRRFDRFTEKEAKQNSTFWTSWKDQ